tara:strand:- start:801 stop:2645 length:1845 start_codon:yes stop_codon:yes gene_type:complete
MALPEIRKTRASQARETAASEKNTQVNIAQTAIQADISTFTKRTAESLKSMFSLQKSQFELERLKAGAELEKEREEARKKKPDDKSLNDKFEDKFGFGIFGIGAMIAGVSAIAGAFVGLRGWEAKAVASISRITRIGPLIVKGITSLRNGVLRIFGLTARGTIIRDPVTGRFMKAPSLVSQVSIALSQLRTRLLRVFGIGADGKLIAIRGAGGQLTKAGSFSKIMQTVIGGVSKIFQPIKAAGQLATKALGGAFGGILKVIGSLGGFAKLFGFILKPIGIIFSVFDGVKTFMSTEGSLFTKINEGISAVIGDFVGAPLDLLKTGLIWVTDNLLGKDNFISKFLKSFSIEKILKDIIATPGRILAIAFDEVTAIFDTSEGKTIGGNIVALFKKMFDAITGIVSSVVNFVAEKLGLDFRMGESEDEKNDRKLEELKKQKDKLAKEEEYVLSQNETLLSEIELAKQRKAKAEQDYQNFLDKRQDAGRLVYEGENLRFTKNIERAEQQIIFRENEIKKKLAEVERKKAELEEKMRLAQIDPTNSIDGTTTGSPSGNGAAQDISLQSLYQRGFTPTEAVSVNSSSNDVSVVNNSNDYGGAQRVQPTNRSYYSNIELIGY